MKRKTLVLLALVMHMLFFGNVRVSAVTIQVHFLVGYVDPEIGQLEPQRGPAIVPCVGIENVTLFFSTPCDGCLLRVVSEDNEVVYSTIIPIGTDTLVLPSSLSGDYELQIISGNYVFYGDISL